MKKSNFILTAIFFIILTLSFFACKKDKKEIIETIISAEDNSTAENEFTSVFDVADDFTSNDTRTRSGNTILPNGAIVTFTDSVFTDGNGIAFTIDFGTLKLVAPKGIYCKDGRYRSGKLSFTASKKYFEIVNVITVSASDADKYYGGNDGTNLTQVTGTTTLTRTTATSLNIDVANAKAVNDKGTVTWKSNRTITKTVDNGAGLLGDEFEVIGSASGVNRNGENFTVTIDVPLYKKIQLGCARTFVKGKITLTNTTSNKTIKIDYDPYNNVACDAVAKATINNKEYYYTVR
ncbi:MAG: hypothetical protein HQ463_05525 [Bacteroidetes bacterium]|nr:hypothetical protein [Bacteroidota bacterium]